jgi:hypothetical protein
VGIVMNNLPKNWDSMSLPRLWDALNDTRQKRAADSTVEAVRYELSRYGIAQLQKPRTQARLANFSAEQVTDMAASLRRMRSRYPAITDEPIVFLERVSQ